MAKRMFLFSFETPPPSDGGLLLRLPCARSKRTRRQDLQSSHVAFRWSALGRRADRVESTAKAETLEPGRDFEIEYSDSSAKKGKHSSDEEIELSCFEGTVCITSNDDWIVETLILDGIEYALLNGLKGYVPVAGSEPGQLVGTVNPEPVQLSAKPLLEVSGRCLTIAHKPIAEADYRRLLAGEMPSDEFDERYKWVAVGAGGMIAGSISISVDGYTIPVLEPTSDDAMECKIACVEPFSQAFQFVDYDDLYSDTRLDAPFDPNLLQLRKFAYEYPGGKRIVFADVFYDDQPVDSGSGDGGDEEFCLVVREGGELQEHCLYFDDGGDDDPETYVMVEGNEPNA